LVDGPGFDGVWHLFHRLLGSPGSPATDDGELLDSFVRRRDQQAFEDLVQRHGPMVLGLCRRILLVVFSPDGKLLAVGTESGQADNKVRIELWDAATWQKVATLEGHTQRILALAFSADGRSLVSGSQDTSARVWDLRRVSRP
jgi:WD40 repeat protein